MGGTVTRAFRNFNLENRATREISKNKPTSAPRHPVAMPGPLPDDPEIQEEIRRKDDKLLALLKEVYVDSREPPVRVKDEGGIIPSKQQEYRLTKLGHLRDLDIPSIPKGKISVVEVLTLLNNYKLSPQTWTAEKIAKEYSIDLKEVTSLLEFFLPFTVEIFPPKDRKVL
ncbi:NADH dehydrogenase [ubiquinone] 1 alpha subcomplex assembly factor 4 [Chelonoidis abingdonii]|uniref:NADH dehydrogenase [ubiquinone] 1 alpha subcomplex assembly factor 4 n=1 Tax=Chelonoidis abingdonii TaxID=106734 RepID=UPI0013F24B89|nr:NADH dehydrogenase [ubiquinone] 1 alpha subcomplex assembly factor 4 isoform X1 [Chelonoidis abingdonii]